MPVRFKAKMVSLICPVCTKEFKCTLSKCHLGANGRSRKRMYTACSRKCSCTIGGKVHKGSLTIEQVIKMGEKQEKQAKYFTKTRPDHVQFLNAWFSHSYGERVELAHRIIDMESPDKAVDLVDEFMLALVNKSKARRNAA